MSNDEIERFLDAEYERAKSALEQAKANLERIQRARSVYVSTPESAEAKIRPHRVFPRILANGRRMTREELLEALKATGWRATYERRDFNKAINSNLASAVIAFDGNRYYTPTESERESILSDGRKKKKSGKDIAG